jgi:hypothetical protein
VRELAAALMVPRSAIYHLLHTGVLVAITRARPWTSHHQYLILKQDAAPLIVTTQPQDRNSGATGHQDTSAVAYTYLTQRGTTYYLHGKEVALPNGRLEMCYTFARALRPAEAVPEVPAGYTVYESPYTGRPYLRKVGTLPQDQHG